MPQFILFRTLKNSCYFEIGGGKENIIVFQISVVCLKRLYFIL